MHRGASAAVLATIAAVVSCGGRVDGSDAGVGDERESGAPPSSNVPDASAADSSPVDAATSPPGATCTDPLQLALGDTWTGTTCMGTMRPGGAQRPCELVGPIVYFTVEAPAGTAYSINPPTPQRLDLIAFADCTNAPQQCVFGSTFTPNPLAPVYGIQVTGETCGDFTITVTGQ